MKNNVDFGQQGTAITDPQRWSPAIWSKCPWGSIKNDPSLGRFWEENWSDFPLIGTQTTQIGHGRYKLFSSASGTINPVSAVNSVEIQGGALKMNTDTDNDAAIIAQSYPSWRMSGSSASSGKLWFEAIVAQKSVVTNMAASFIGFGETDLMTLAVALPLNAGDPITNDGAMIGFRIEEDGLGVIDTVYSDRATSFTNIGDTEGGTLVAYTFKHLGILYDPLDIDRCVRFFTDNVECSTALSRAALVALTNLDANALGFLAGTVADSAGTAHELYIRGWRCAQLNPGQAA